MVDVGMMRLPPESIFQMPLFLNADVRVQPSHRASMTRSQSQSADGLDSQCIDSVPHFFLRTRFESVGRIAAIDPEDRHWTR